MQQDRGGGGGDQEMKPNLPQDRRLKPLQQGENQQQQQQHHQPQKCPRCDSMNTKFCYYNNYSLSQPRYFCKTCRRYWTQGGTLRNVPVGGGCRKGKRTKTSSSSSGEHSRSSAQPHQPPPLQQNFTNPNTALVVVPSNPVLKDSGNLGSSPAAISSMGYYPGGGFLSSLAAIQSLNQQQAGFSHPLNQPLNVGGDLGGSSNLGLLQGYGVSPFGSQQHQPIQPSQFYQMAGREKAVNTFYPTEQESMAAQSSRPWHQNFINNANPTTASDAALWSINSTAATTTSTGNTNSSNTTGSSSSLNPNQWPDLPGYGAPP